MIASLVLCHASIRRERVARLKDHGQPIRWLFLCQDYLRFLEWQERFNGSVECVPVGELLNNAADELRTPFLDVITDLGRRFNSIAWWSSRLSERNTMVSPLFLYCCYLKVATDALRTKDGTLLVISESWEVLESLASDAARLGVSTSWLSSPLPGRLQVEFVVRTVVRLFRFFQRALAQMISASGFQPGASRQQTVLMRTWLDEGCLGEDGAFHDRYLPGLYQWLIAHGYEVVTIPELLSLERSYSSAWKWLRQSQQTFLNPFRFYTVTDYLFALAHAWRQLRLGLGESTVDLAGLNATDLFVAEQERQFCDTRCLDSILSYRLPRRLAKRNFKPDVLIDAFENMIPDKLLVLGFRQYLPNTRLVGFQHASLYPLMLCLFVTKGEAEFAPIPDRLVCNGESFRSILVKEGLPAERAIVGPALRYTHLWPTSDRNEGPSGPPSIVLVPLPLVLDSAVELFLKVLTALESFPDLRIWLKPHPMSSLQALLTAAKLKQLPENFEFVQGGMAQLLKQAKLVVALNSSTVHEALAAGLPVVVVGRESALDLNPLSWYADLDRVVRTIEGLRAEVNRLLTLSSEDLDRYRQRAAEVVRSCFNPVTDANMRMFVDGVKSFAEIPPKADAFQVRPDRSLATQR